MLQTITAPPPDLLQDRELETLLQTWDELGDRIVRGEDVVAKESKPEYVKALAAMRKDRAILLGLIRARSWQTITLTWDYPNENEWGDRPAFAMVSGKGTIRTDERGMRVMDCTYTRPELALVIKLLAPK